MKRRTAVIAVIISAVCFGTLAIFTSLAYRQGAEPLQLLAWRFGAASLLLGGYFAIIRPRALWVGRGDLGRYAVLAVAGYGAASLCFFFALLHADAGVVAVLFYTYPALVTLAARLFGREALDLPRAVAIALTFAGCALVVDPFSGGQGVSTAGVLLGLGAAVGYASFNVLSHRWLPGRSRGVLMTYTFGFNTIAIVFIASLVGAPLAPVGWTWETWMLLGAIVLVPTFAAVLLYLRAMRQIGPAQASIISTFEPLVTIGLAALVLGERLSIPQAAGAVLVLAGVVLAEFHVRDLDEVAIV
ncbi:MAG: DMT family transporter [Clostridiales bacterium]|nr:DMT family transporter [Clostridiales bacterium]